MRGAAGTVAPAAVTCSFRLLKDRTLGFSCLHGSISSSSDESGRCLAEIFERFRRRRHRYSKPINAASASAPSVQPRTIARVLLLPSPAVLPLEEVVAAVGNVAGGVEVGLGVMEELEVGGAVEDEVLLDALLVEELDKELVGDVEDESLVDVAAVVEAVSGASTDVTTV